MPFPDHEAPRRAQGQGQLLRPLCQRRLGQHHDQRAAKAVPSAQLQRWLHGAARPALPALPDQALLGPCVDRISEADYGELVRQAKDFLGGKSGAVQREIETQMSAAAEALDFERAAMLRDRLRAATFIQGSQAINAEGVGNGDVFAMATKGGQIAIQAFFIRGGQNWGHRAFFPSHTEGLEEAEVMTSFLAQFYEEVPPPRLIMVDRALPGRNCWPRPCRKRLAARWRSACRSAATAAA
jgi:hypothetical protein